MRPWFIVACFVMAGCSLDASEPMDVNDLQGEAPKGVEADGSGCDAPPDGAGSDDLQDVSAMVERAPVQRPPADNYTVDATLSLQPGERGIIWAWCRDGETRVAGSCEPAPTTQGADQYGQRFGWACGWYAFSGQRFVAHAVCAPK